MAPKTLTSFQEIESEWIGMLPSSPVNTLFLSPQWQQVWWENFGDGKTMAGFYVPSPNGVDAIASLTCTGNTLAFLGSQETVDYNDFMVRQGFEAPFFEVLMGQLEDQPWEVMQLDSLVETSPTLQHLPDLARGRGYSVEVQQEDTASGIQLPATWDDYLAVLSKKNRHELRRKFRRLEAQPDWRWYVVTDPDEVSSRLDDFLRLMRLSRSDKAEYMTSDREKFFRHMSRRMAEVGVLRLHFMELEGATVAASLCFDYASSRLLYNSGYDPDYGYYSVGLLLNALCLRESIEQGLEYFDFLRGSETYKQHLGGTPRNLYQMTVRRS